MCELFVCGPVDPARERAVEVDAVRPQARARARGFGREARDHDDPARHLLRTQVLQQLEAGDLALVLAAVVPSHDERGRAVAARGRGARDALVRPAAGVRRLRDLETPDLASRGAEVDRALDRMAAHAPSARSASRVIGSPTNAMPFPCSTTGTARS